MQTMNPSSSEVRKIECAKCNDEGVIFEVVRVQSGENSLGEPYYIDVAKTDETGSLPKCECFYTKLFEKYNASAGMKEEERAHTFKTAQIDDDNRPHYEIAVDFVKNIDYHRKNGTWLYIFGDERRAQEFGCSAYGTGKTFLMQCIGNALTLRKIPALYVPEFKLFDDIKATYSRNSDESESEVLNRYYNVPILLIDDLFTAQYNTEWAESKLYNILESRRGNKKITIITSNYALNRISERLPINGPKIASRLLGESILIEMIGKDRRMDRAKKRYEERKELGA